MTNEDVANDINNYFVNLFTVENKDINQAEEIVQAAGITLYDYLDTSENAELFKYFANADNRARLLNLKIVSNLSRKSKILDNLCTRFNIDDVEDLETLVNNTNSLHELAVNILTPELVDTVMSEAIPPTFDVGINIYDLPEEMQELWFNSDKKNKEKLKEEFRQKVGDTGEAAARDFLEKQYLDKGYTLESKDIHAIHLIKDDSKVSIYLNNFVDSKQEGFDIRVDVDGVSEYFEIKSHTVRSKLRGTFKLSKAQYRQYIHDRSHFNVLLMLIDTTTEDFKGEVEMAAMPFTENQFEPAMKEYWYAYKE